MSRRLLLATVVGTCLAVAAAAARPAWRAPDAMHPVAAVAPSDAEATRLLLELHRSALAAPDASAFCAESTGQGQCITQYEHPGGRRAVPTAAPTVVGSRVMGGTRVLTVCGVDGSGHSYRSDFPVERDGGRLVALFEVFWYSKTFSGTVPDGQPVPVVPGEQRFSC